MDNLASTTTSFSSTMSEYLTQLVVVHDKYQIHLFLALILSGYVISLLKSIQKPVQESFEGFSSELNEIFTAFLAKAKAEVKQDQTLLQKLTYFKTYSCLILNILLYINILTHYYAKPSLFSTDLPKFAISHLLENPYLAYFILSLVLILIKMIVEVRRLKIKEIPFSLFLICLPFFLIGYLSILFLSFLNLYAIFYFKAIFSNSDLIIIFIVFDLFYDLRTKIFNTMLSFLLSIAIEISDKILEKILEKIK
jgi:hypothetical protein